MKTVLKKQEWFAVFIFFGVVPNACPQSLPGIPEPGLTLYGEVRNTAGGGNVRMIAGTLRWTVRPAVGAPITIVTALRNINDQFSYVVRIPFESVLTGFTLSANTLQLTSAPAGYARSATVEDVSALVVAPALTSFTFSAADRGRVERVDLQVSIAIVDTDGDGIPDAWENQFGLLANDSSDAASDKDGDTFSNLSEYLAGTNPTDPNSLFKFIGIATNAPGEIRIGWSSVAGKSYSVRRSTALENGFAPLATGIQATPPLNSYQDLSATGASPYFYWLLVE